MAGQRFMRWDGFSASSESACSAENPVGAFAVLDKGPEAGRFLDNHCSAYDNKGAVLGAALLITLQALELHPIVVSMTYEPGELDYHGADFQQSSPLHLQAVAEREGSDIRIRGNIVAKIRAACDRCLVPVELAVDPVFDLFYREISAIPREEEIEVPASELDVAFYSGEGVAVADLVTEQVILAVPSKVVCRPDCRGLCPMCGANRNQFDCGCRLPGFESPFASLKGELSPEPFHRGSSR